MSGGVIGAAADELGSGIEECAIAESGDRAFGIARVGWGGRIDIAGDILTGDGNGEAEFFGRQRQCDERLCGADTHIKRVVVEEFYQLLAKFRGAAIACEIGSVSADGG